jgi:hypothetical protein
MGWCSRSKRFCSGPAKKWALARKQKKVWQSIGRLAVLLTFCLIASGCSPMRYSQYSGNAVWPTTQGSLAEADYAIPVYRSFPERPYDVIGSVRFEDPRRYWDDGIIRMAAETGKKNGGDAIIFRTGSAAPMSWLDTFISRPTGYGQEQTALVIKWTPDNVVQERHAEAQLFWANFKQHFPDLSLSDRLVQLAQECLIEQGVRQNSPEMETRLSELLKDIQGQPKSTLAGKWLFKGAVQNRNLTTAETQTFHGVASIGLTGNKLTLISNAGATELNFSGILDAGQITGTLGFGGNSASVSTKCDGVALDNKISMTFQKLIDSGTVQGTLTFQR